VKLATSHLGKTQGLNVHAPLSVWAWLGIIFGSLSVLSVVGLLIAKKCKKEDYDNDEDRPFARN
jgi:hypothetical protein